MGVMDAIELVESMRLWKQRDNTNKIEKALHPLLEALGSYFSDTDTSMSNSGPLSRASFGNDNYTLKCDANSLKDYKKDKNSDGSIEFDLEISVLPKGKEWEPVYKRRLTIPQDTSLIPDITEQEVKPALEKILY